GTLGRRVDARLRAADRPVRVLTRGKRVRKEATGDGIEYVTADLGRGGSVGWTMDDVEGVVHCAGGPSGGADKARHLADAAARAGVRHIVYISVVGADRIPTEGRIDRAMFGYFRSKREAGRIIAESGVPWSTLHATQFHQLLLATVDTLTKM